MAKIAGPLTSRKRVGPLTFCKNLTVRAAKGLLGRRRTKRKVEDHVECGKNDRERW